MDNAFNGIKNLYSQSGLDKIQSAHFLVVGIGGVGSWICESLVRSGALRVSIVDLDDICISNINRQIHSLHSNVGKLKIEEMKARMLSINPNVKVECIYNFFSESSKEEILNKEYDYVFDAIDSLKSKCILIDECKKRNIPVVCIGAAGGRVDPTQIEVKDLNRTINDQLLYLVRKDLRKNHGFWKFHDHPYRIPTVFSKEFPRKPQVENCEASDSKKMNCQTGFGSASFVTASFAFAAVSHALTDIAAD